MEEEKRKHISASQLSTFELCGEAYRRRYIEGTIIPPGIALIRGSGVHAGAKVNFTQKKDSHKDLPKKDIIDASVAGLEDATKNGVLLTENEESIGAKNVLGKTKDEVATLSGIFADDIAPKYQPAFVEEKQRITLTEDYDLVAIMDLADVDEIIVDLKTSGKKKNQSEVDSSEQLSIYSLVYKAKTGHLPKQVRLETLVNKKKPEAQMLKSTRQMQDLQIVVNRLNVMLDSIKKGVFVPCNPGSWKCNQMYCGYYNTCPYVKNK